MSEKFKKRPCFTKEKAELLRKTLGRFDDEVTVDPLRMEEESTELASLTDRTFLLHVLIETLCCVLEKDEYKRKQLFNSIYKDFEANNVIHSAINVDSLAQSRREGALRFYEHIKQVHRSINPLLNEQMYEIQGYNIPISKIEKYNEAFDEVQVIARGGFGIVCKARHKVDSAIYAVKKIIFEYRRDSDYVKVMREVRNLSSLSNKYIVAYNNAWIQPIYEQDLNSEDLDSDSDYTEDQSTEASNDEQFMDDSNAASVALSNHTHKFTSCDKSGSIMFQNNSNDIQLSLDIKKESRRLATCSESSSIIFKNDSNDSQLSLDTKYESKSNRVSSCSESSSSTCNDPNDSKFGLDNLQDSKSSRICVCNESGNSSQNDLNDSQSSLDTMHNSKSNRHSNSSESGSIVFQNYPKSNLNINQSKPFHSDNSLGTKEDQFKKLNLPILRIKMMLCIQMEYCDYDLRHWLDARNEGCPLPFTKSVPDIFKEIVCGVAYIHEKGIIHRDLKPQNIFFSKEKGVMKVGDFGLATLSYNPSDEEQSSSTHSTNLGTLPYAAPEQRSNSVYDSKVDMYSLGIILIELLVKISTKMEFFKIIDNFKRGVLPKEINEGWPEYIPLLTNLLQEDCTYRMNAKQVLDMPLFKDKKEGSNLEERVKDLEKELANKEKKIQELQEQEQIIEQRFRKQISIMEQKFQAEKQAIEKDLVNKEHVLQQITKEVKLLKEDLDRLQ